MPCPPSMKLPLTVNSPVLSGMVAFDTHHMHVTVWAKGCRYQKGRRKRRRRVGRGRDRTEGTPGPIVLKTADAPLFHPCYSMKLLYLNAHYLKTPIVSHSIERACYIFTKHTLSATTEAWVSKSFCLCVRKKRKLKPSF